jgi:hypothetical protein
MPNSPTWFTDTVTVLRAGTTVDRYGDTVLDWDNPTETEVEHCKVNPAAGQDDPGRLDDRAGLTKRWVMSAPRHVDIRSTDRIRWSGIDFEIEGEVLPWDSPYGGASHLLIQLVRVEG